jgi:hypothetical protein
MIGVAPITYIFKMPSLVPQDFNYYDTCNSYDSSNIDRVPDLVIQQVNAPAAIFLVLAATVWLKVAFSRSFTMIFSLKESVAM